MNSSGQLIDGSKVTIQNIILVFEIHGVVNTWQFSYRLDNNTQSSFVKKIEIMDWDGCIFHKFSEFNELFWFPKKLTHFFNIKSSFGSFLR